MVLKVNDLNLFFIHYATGTFGSSLYHALMSSQEFIRYYEITIDVFNKDSAAHKNIFHMFNNFHTNPEIQLWKNLNYQEKISYLDLNLNSSVIETKLLQPPVLIASYDALLGIKDVLKNSKNIIILFEKDKIELLSKIRMKKLKDFNFYFLNINGKIHDFSNRKLNPKSIKLLNNLTFKHFYEQQQHLIFNKEDFVFNFEDFFTYKSFESRFKSLCKHFHLTFNNEFIENFYSNFYENNKEFLL
jgi:hypothetical protein